MLNHADARFAAIIRAWVGFEKIGRVRGRNERLA